MRRPSLISALVCPLLVCLSGCEVKPPGRLETASVQWVKHHVTVGGRNDRNPLPASHESVDQGKRTFGDYCVECHGRDGQNTGVPFASQISPPIPSLASSEVQRYTDGQLRWIIANGISPSGMPASKGILGDDEIWQIVLYLRHLPPQGSLGDPRAYSQDEYGEDQPKK
jgi:mono/diheme cytochrome c family protein